jgi:hypothetical protein
VIKYNLFNAAIALWSIAIALCLIPYMNENIFLMPVIIGATGWICFARFLVHPGRIPVK